MHVIWYKVWFDLWRNKTRTMLAIFSIAAGVFTVGAIFGMLDQLLSTMDAAHLAVSPSHIALSLNQAIDRNHAARLENIEGVAGVDVVNSISVRYKRTPQDEWQPGLIISRDYEDQKYDKYALIEGPWPTKNAISVERLSSGYFGFEIGDEVIFELDKTDRALPITGIIRHPFINPPAFGGNAIFFMDGPAQERFNIPEGKFDGIYLAVTPYSEGFAKDVASQVKSRLAKENIGVVFTVYQDPVEHWGRPFIEGINFILQILAVISLFLSVILVTNTLTALITQQTDQIGIIKAIGGSSKQIIKIYLAVVFIYGLLALLISLPLGVIVAFALSRWFLNLFNIEYNVFQASTQAIIFQVIAALVVPLLAALWPVLKGANITVREAIASYGLGGDFGFSRLDRTIERLGQQLFSTPYAIALGNMFRRKGRLVLTQLVLVTAGVMFLLVMSLSSSIRYTLDNDLARRSFDIRLSFLERHRVDRVLKMATSLEGVQQAEMWFIKSVSLLLQGQRLREAGVGAEIVGIPGDSHMFRPLIVSGRWLRPDDDRSIVIAKDLADEYNIDVGNTVTLDLGELGDSEWQVVGITQIIVEAAFSADPIYAPLEAIFNATRKHNEAARLIVASNPATTEQVDKLNQQLKDLYAERHMDFNIFTSGTSQQDLTNALNQYAILINMFLAMAVIVGGVGGMGLMGSLFISVVERTREIGVMRAVGAKSQTIMRMFIMEGVLQGLLSWTITIPISFFITQPVAKVLGQIVMNVPLDFNYNFTAVLVWLIIILFISTLASILPARNATQISVRESLSYA